MNTIGGFREGEFDGKPFHIFTFLSQTHNLSSSGEAAPIYSDNDLSLQPLFLCPNLRRKAENLKREENGYCSEDNNVLLPYNTSPHYPNIRSVDQQVQYLLDPDNDDNDTCKLPIAPLFWCNSNDYSYLDCRACINPMLGTNYYFCVTCCKKFHKECVESPLEIKHPSYPFLSLQLYNSPRDDGSDQWSCICCGNLIRNITAYHCPTHNVSMHPLCAMKPIPIVIDHPKRHPHNLTFFPKQDYLPCNVCGLIEQLIPTYVCLRCVFVVHQDCIYFPYVIRICRHQHRISFTSSLPSGIWFCGVCRQKVDNKYGAYSCNKCSDYFVHPRCALRSDLWDGKELEGVPEETEIVVEPFVRIADGIILHFSHGHHLKLETNKVYDKEIFCQACILPIYDGSFFYSCLDQCDFILHEACANAPLKKHHPLHPRSLTLKVVTNEYDHKQGHFNCDACLRNCCGFVYEDLTGEFRFRLDLRCGSVFEPFEYQGHEHPLFLALKPEEEDSAICQICQEDSDEDYCRKLNCIECNYIICFKCATLPYKASYKHDKHFLTFYKAEEASDNSGWCEVCERKLVYSRKGGLYSCDDCCTTLHIECLLGKDPYMKPGQTIEKGEIQILSNKTMSRPFCHGFDEDRCLDRVVYKKKNITFCSVHCTTKRVERSPRSTETRLRSVYERPGIHLDDLPTNSDASLSP